MSGNARASRYDSCLARESQARGMQAAMSPFLRAIRTLAVLAPVALFASGCADLSLGIANSADRISSSSVRTANVAYGSDPRHRLDVYVPAQRPARAATAIVFIHGGRWNSGSKDEYRFIAAGLAERGFVVVVPNYRLYPRVRMAEGLDDVARAVAWAQTSAGEYGADGARVIVAGHSSGAHFAAMLAFDARWLSRAGGRPVQGFAGFSGPYDFLPLKDADLIDYFGPPERFADSQPANFVGRESPPAFLVHGLADTVVAPRNTQSLASRLEAAGVRVELHLQDTEDHGGTLRRFARFYRGDDAVYAAFVRFAAGR